MVLVAGMPTIGLAEYRRNEQWDLLDSHAEVRQLTGESATMCVYDISNPNG